MLLFFIIFIFFILHIQFLLRNIFFGLDEVSYFQFVIKYVFDRAVAIQSLQFSILCVFCFAVCYKIFYKTPRVLSTKNRNNLKFKLYAHELLLMNVVGIALIIYMLSVISLSNFNYSAMTQIREGNGFIFELRMIFLLVFSHISLNVHWRDLFSDRKYKLARRVFAGYFIAVILFQARSAVFEIVAVVVFSQLMWSGDRVKYKYIFILIGLLLVPNLIVLGRLGIPEKSSELISGLFSFEYTVLINNFLSAAIDSTYRQEGGITFFPTLMLLVPSPLRDLLGIVVTKSNYYSDLSAAAGVGGGGFSLLAEMYSNFGWMSLVVFGLFGSLIGYLNKRASRVGFVGLLDASAPLIYAAFVLAFRNDFGVFVKYGVQLILISLFLRFAFKLRIGK